MRVFTVATSLAAFVVLASIGAHGEKPPIAYAHEDALEYADEHAPAIADGVWTAPQPGVITHWGRVEQALQQAPSTGAAHLTASPTALVDGGDLVISWADVEKPHAKDFVGLSCGPQAHTRDFLATVGVDHPDATSNSVRFSSLFMMRCNYTATYMNFDPAVNDHKRLATLTVPMADSFDAPKHGHIALTSQLDEMVVMFNSASKRTPQVKYGLDADSLTMEASGNWTTYHATDMCDAPATTVSQVWFRDPGYMHKVFQSANTYRDWIEELQEMANLPESQPRGTRFGSSSDNNIIPHVITEKYLADLTRKYVRARHARSRYVNAWSDLVQEAAETQAILDSAASKKLDFGEVSPHATFWEKTAILTPYTRYLYYYQILPYAQVLLGLFLAAASACIVWSEVVKFAFPKLSIIRLTVVHHWVGDKPEVGFAGQAISSFWICYMCAAALISMTEVKVWRGRALVRRNTAHESAFWYAMQVAKLTIPISYNFITFLSSQVYNKTVFYHFLGQLIDFTPLGRYFDDLFPVVVLFPVFATLFGIYGRVKRIFVGMDVMDDEEENGTTYGTGSWREGRDLISRELGGNTLFHRREDALARIGAAGTVGGRSAPILSIPSAHGAASSPARSPARAPAANARRGPEHRYGANWNDEPPEDDNLFTIIGHRMKNTMDGIEAPKWFNDIKKPKWMGGDDDTAGAGSSSSGPDFRRWFGGSSEGQIRI